MRVIEAGHQYELASVDGECANVLTFVKRFRGAANHAGTTNQEVLRALIDRIEVLHAEKPHDANAKIIEHLRLALVLHEARALERKVERGDLKPERVAFAERDGHFLLSERAETKENISEKK